MPVHHSSDRHQIPEPGNLISASVFALTSPPITAPEVLLPAAFQEEAPITVAVGQLYEGPLDVLLDLIRKQNIDIYDIPIAAITAQFLEYTRTLQLSDIELAGEFAYTASLLIHIKSRMLLPVDPLGAATPGADPRQELVNSLLDHERFKNAATAVLIERKQIEDKTVHQPAKLDFLDGWDITTNHPSEPDSVDLFRLFEEVRLTLRERPVHEVDVESITVPRMVDYVKRSLALADRPVNLRSLLGSSSSQSALICIFLGVLELVRLRAILIRQGECSGDILLKRAPEFEEIVTSGLPLRDDWA